MKKDLNAYRSEIDILDRQLAALLAERFSVVDEIAEYKKANGLPVYHASREEAVLQKVAGIAGEKYANDVKQVYKTVFEVSRDRQT